MEPTKLSNALQDKPNPDSHELTARDFRNDLSGTFKERMEEEKSILITLRYGSRPEVKFSGFWNGKLISSAMNAISRSYRVLRHKNIRTHANEQNTTTEVKGDG